MVSTYSMRLNQYLYRVQNLPVALRVALLLVIALVFYRLVVPSSQPVVGRRTGADAVVPPPLYPPDWVSEMPDADLLIDLFNKLRLKADSNGAVVMLYVNYAFIVQKYVENFFHFSRKSKLSNIVCVAMDPLTVQYLEVREFCGIVDASVWKRDAFLPSDEYRRVNAVKAVLGLYAIEFGFSILFSGADVLYAKNPFHYFLNDSDVEQQFQYFGPESAVVGFQHLDHLNNDFFFVRSNKKTKLIMKHFHDATMSDLLVNDQDLWNGLVRKYNHCFQRRRTLEDADEVSCYMLNGPIYETTFNVRCISYCIAPFSDAYTHRECREPAAIHYTGNDKFWRMRESGMWLYEMDTYLYGPWIRLDFSKLSSSLPLDAYRSLLIAFSHFTAKIPGMKLVMPLIPCKLHPEYKVWLHREECSIDFFFRTDVMMELSFIRPQQHTYMNPLLMHADRHEVTCADFDLATLRCKVQTSTASDFTPSLARDMGPDLALIAKTRGNNDRTHFVIDVVLTGGVQNALPSNPEIAAVQQKVGPSFCFLEHNWDNWVKAGYTMFS
eukprot:ANDGO_07320.mRNA.1 hypothetical protein